MTIMIHCLTIVKFAVMTIIGNDKLNKDKLPRRLEILPIHCDRGLIYRCRDMLYLLTTKDNRLGAVAICEN